LRKTGEQNRDQKRFGDGNRNLSERKKTTREAMRGPARGPRVENSTFFKPKGRKKDLGRSGFYDG